MLSWRNSVISTEWAILLARVSQRTRKQDLLTRGFLDWTESGVGVCRRAPLCTRVCGRVRMHPERRRDGLLRSELRVWGRGVRTTPLGLASAGHIPAVTEAAGTVRGFKSGGPGALAFCVVDEVGMSLLGKARLSLKD